MSLTKHAEGSLRELWAIAFPLMLSSFSVLTMVFCDRWFLAHYSSEAHNAAVEATTLGWAFLFGWMVLASIAEVFVAQYNGAGKRHRFGEPVWQMIWLSMASWAFFIPLSLWGTGWIFGDSAHFAYEREYFSIMVLFGPFYALYAALCAFFIGQGKTRLITIVVVFANLCNILCDWILIFGIDGLVEPFGVKGAAMATSIATLFQCAVLGAIFLRKKNRQECGTFCWQPKLSAMRDCVRIGLPSAIFVVAEISAYAVFYALMKEMGDVYITVTGICQSLLILFFFFADGMNKAVATIVGNLIGAGRSAVVSKVMKSGLQLNLIFLVIVLAVFSWGMPLIVDQFLPYADEVFIASIQGPLETCLILMAVYLFFEGVRLQFAGVLMAAGDTYFLLAAGSLLVWALMLLPVYVFVLKGHARVELASTITMLYSAIACIVYYWRIDTGKWRTLSISKDLSTASQE